MCKSEKICLTFVILADILGFMPTYCEQIITRYQGTPSPKITIYNTNK